MKFKDKKLGVSFEVPDKFTVRDQLRYKGVTSTLDSEDFLINLWHGARLFIQKWECEKFPDFDVSIDKIHDPAIADIVSWAGMQVLGHIRELETPKKKR